MNQAEQDRTVFIVDDDPAARDSVAALVSAHGVAVEVFEGGIDFLRAHRPDCPGVVVLDVKMADLDGLAVLHEFRRRGATNPVIVITGYGDIPTAVEAMRLGAWTFLEKPCSDQELWHHIGNALQSEVTLSEELRLRRRWAARLAELTPEERQVLELLLQGKVSKAIAADLDIGQRTVELRRASIMRKMEADSLAQLVRKVVAAQSLSEQPSPGHSAEGA